MTRIYVPAESPDAWRRLLADPDRQWREGDASKRLALAWMMAEGFPPAVDRALHLSGHELFRGMDILLAVPAHGVALPGGSAASKSDLFVLAGSAGQLTVFVVEGKLSQGFGPTVTEWQKDFSDDRKTRLEFICSTLGLGEERVAGVAVQLLERTAAALSEARRFNAENAVMLVHSFSAARDGSDNFVALAKLFGLTPEPNRLHFAGYIRKRRLFLGWVADA